MTADPGPDDATADPGPGPGAPDAGRAPLAEVTIEEADAEPAEPVSTVDAAALLAEVPLFSDLPEHVRVALAAAGQWHHLPGGSFLFHQGDAADGMALLWSGRVDVVDERHTTVINVLGRGSWVGELALLTGAPRAAGIRARRDTVFLVIPSSAFDAALAGEPGLSLTLARTLAAQVQGARQAPSPPTEPDTITVVALDEALPVDDLVWRLAHDVARFGPVAVVGDDGAVLQSEGPNLGPLHPSAAPAAEVERAWARRIDGLEAEHPWVVLVSHDPAGDPAWASFCVRSSDRIVALCAEGAPVPGWATELLGRHRADVAVLASATAAGRSEIAPVLDALAPRAHHRLAEGARFLPAADRLARRVSGHALGVVLSGGGARGLAHLGVIERLVEAGVGIDRIGGCSAGAFAAALFAMGHSPAEMIAICRQELVDRRPFTDFTVPREALIRGHKTMAMLTRVFGDTQMEDLTLSAFAVSADLATGELVVHRRGLVREAVAASMSIPGFSPPLAVGERLLVDGGLLDNLPVDVMQEIVEGPVVAVDVMRRFPIADPGQRHGGPGIVSTIARSMVLGGWQRAEQNRQRAEVVISPIVDDIGLFEFDRIDDAIAAGHRAADEALTAGLPTAARASSPSATLPL